MFYDKIVIILLLCVPSACFAGGIDGYVKLMVHANGVDGSTAFVDSSESEHSLTAVGNAQIDNAIYKFGQSIMLDGTGDYLELPDSSDWELSGSFTIDFWFKFNSVKNYTWFVGQGGANGTNFWCFMYTVNELAFYVSVADNTTFSFLRDFSPSTGVWYHFAIVNNAGDWSIYVDGSRLGAVYNNSYAIPDLAASLFVGAGTNGTNNYPYGWLDELRISKVARWSSNFDVPTEEYAPPPTPSPSPSPTPSPSPSPTPGVDYAVVEDEKYFMLMSLAGCLCAFIFGVGIILAMRK